MPSTSLAEPTTVCIPRTRFETFQVLAAPRNCEWNDSASWQTPFDSPEDCYPQLQAGVKALTDIDRYLFSSEPFPSKNKHLEEFSASFEVSRQRCSFINGEFMSWYGSRLYMA